MATRRQWIGWVLACAGVAFVAMLVWRAGPLQVWQTLVGMEAWVLLLLAAPFVGVSLHVLGWRAVVPKAVRPGFWRAFRVYLAALAVDEVGAGVLGEPLKAAGFPRSARFEVVGALVLDNVAQALAIAACMAGSGIWLAGTQVAGAGVAAVLGAAGMTGVAALLLGGLWLGTLPVVASKAQTSGPRLRRLLHRWSEVSKTSTQSVRQRPAAFASCFVLHAMGKFWIVPEFALGLALVGQYGWDKALWLASGSMVGSVVGAAIPAQAGVLEGAVMASAIAAGVPAPEVLAVMLVRRFRSALWLGVGFWLAGGVVRESKENGVR